MKIRISTTKKNRDILWYKNHYRTQQPIKYRELFKENPNLNLTLGMARNCNVIKGCLPTYLEV